ncbi:MAG: arabinose efflux permease family protein [Actinomycetia bacterium]|nr:arabinose efflux permease family protein [Actinomycetes bacterium]
MRDGVWSPARRQLTVGLTLTISLVALESLAIGTVLPKVSDDLGGVSLYGWVFSAFFLGTMVGIVVAGQSADRLGAAPGFTVGLSLFALGLLAGGLAPTMLVLVLARAVQGFGAGAVPAIGYVAIGRSYPEALRPRMFAVLSSAWVIPGILGPTLATVVEHAFGWRTVFMGLLPFVIVAGILTLPSLRPIGPGTVDDDDVPDRSRLPDALRVAAGAAAVLAGLGNHNPLLLAALVIGGAVVAWPAYLRLVPAGTVQARPGLPAAVLERGILTFAFFGADAYVPLALHEVRGMSTFWIGVSVTLTTLTWTTGAWMQERLVHRVGARRLVVLGHAIILGGIAVTALMLWRDVPVAVGFVGWTVGGLGIGLAYAPISLTVLREAPAGREGAVTSALQLTDQLGVSLGTGFGGAAVAVGDARGWDAATGIAVAWGVAAAVAVVGMLVGRRLPGPVAVVEPTSVG